MKKPQKKVRGTTPTVVPNNGAACADASEPLLFYMPDATYGELCQWFPASFAVSKAEMTSLIGSPIDDNDDNTEDNITFNCAEQFMMYCKAGRFDDKATQRRILATDSPKKQKRLGGLVAGFKASSWDEVKSTVVVAGNMAKFGQNPKLRGKLLATGDRLLAEAASRDRVWGIGYTAKHAMSFRSKWEENRLGRALMVVRECLREEQKGEGAGYARSTAPS